jgi:hypothetical protein
MALSKSALSDLVDSYPDVACPHCVPPSPEVATMATR